LDDDVVVLLLLVLVIVLLVSEVGEAGVDFPQLECVVILRCPPCVVLRSEEVALEIFVLLLELQVHILREFGDTVTYLCH
jgi:hypothetical protein